MELKYLYTVKTILEAGSFQNAARQLNYTQSTITFQMQQLEQELNVKIFEKIGRKMVLTQAGKEILPLIDNIIKSTEQISNYGKSTLEISGDLNVAIPESLLIYKFQPLLKAFKEQAPRVKLSLQALNCYVIKDKIVSGGADLGIHYDVGGSSTSVINRSLSAHDLVLIASPLLAEDQHNFTAKNQVKAVSMIVNDPSSIFQQKFDQYIKDKNIVMDNIIEVGSIEATKRCVSSNLGVAYLPRFTVEEELRNQSLIELPTELESERITAICSHHKNKWLSPAMELFVSLLEEHLV
ncbi:LysR family transcriptional regulator [Bacillus sp. FJAT-27264]|uniref:LysR family transcriptional regulator n=1 Tax=Paenibacillus sp. (strain DSM 101736 / FJAT-27264) TaxID=1850362 RepID=UPI000808000A|nr:LysR family transcriptional regulator [Bacillus sp. FJAT-27264]OBZ14707.1 LysR family transcriptional regulator [Bacillus sp. FJAT-27264]